MSNQDKKAAKKKKRVQRKKENQHYKENRLLSVDFFPCGEPEFDAAIRRIFRQFLRTPRDFLCPLDVRVLRCLNRNEGDRKWYLSHSDEEWLVLLNDAMEALAGEIFRALSPSIVQRYCPDNIFNVNIGQSLRFQVTYTKIIHQATKEGTIHFSSKTTKVTVNRLPAKIAFTSHAFERIVERCLPNQSTYNGIGMIHSLFGGKLMFEPTDDHEMLRVYFMSRPEDLGLPNKTGIVYVLVGYCPIEFHFAEHKNQTSSWVAKTFLVLGMKNTPERKLINQLPPKLQGLLHERLRDIIAFRDHGMFLWFQYNNHPCLYTKTKSNKLVPVNVGWSKYEDKLDLCKTPADSLEFFLKRDLQKLIEKTTIPLP